MKFPALVAASMLVVTASGCDFFIDVTGHVVDQTQHPVEGAGVVLTWRHFVDSTTTDSAGRFRTRLPVYWYARDSSHVSACKAGVGYARQSLPMGDALDVKLALAAARPGSSHAECHDLTP